MQQFKKTLLIICIALCSAIFFNLSHANTATWQPTSTVREGSTSVYTGQQHNNKETHQGIAKFRPTAQQVGKAIVRTGAVLAVDLAIQQLLNGVDYVLDPKLQKLKFPACSVANKYHTDLQCDTTIHSGKKTYRFQCWPYSQHKSYDEIGEQILKDADAGKPEAIDYVAVVADELVTQQEKEKQWEATRHLVASAKEKEDEGAAPNEGTNASDSDKEGAENTSQDTSKSDNSDGKQAKHLNDKQIADLVNDSNWHKTNLKQKIAKAYSKELKGSKKFDFYRDPKTGDIFIKGNKSKDMIKINLDKFLK